MSSSCAQDCLTPDYMLSISGGTQQVRVDKLPMTTKYVRGFFGFPLKQRRFGCRNVVWDDLNKRYMEGCWRPSPERWVWRPAELPLRRVVPVYGTEPCLWLDTVKSFFEQRDPPLPTASYVARCSLRVVAGCWAGCWGETKWTRPPVRGPTRLRRLGEAFSKDLVPGNRHEPGLGGIGEPRAGTIPGWDTPADAADNH